jgi:hypothetical protein
MKTKTMRKYLLFLSACLFLSPFIYGQAGKIKSLNISTGAELVAPDASLLRQTHRAGGGISLKGEYVFANHSSFTLATGFLSLAGKKVNNTTTNKSFSAIPIKAGLRYYLGNFYISGECGIAFLQGFKQETALAYAFGLGDELFIFGNGNSLDISVRHEAWVKDGTRSIASLRLAYEFRLR